MSDRHEAQPPSCATPGEGGEGEPSTGHPYYGPWQALILFGITLTFTELVVSEILVETMFALPHLFPSLIGRPSPLRPWLQDGGFLTVLGLVKTPVGVALVSLFVWSRTRHPRDYLGLHDVAPKMLALWLGLQVLLTIFLDSLRWTIGQPLVPQWLEQVYRTAPSVPLLFVALVVVVPVFEETLFRGFLLPSLIRTRLGPAGGILVTAALFALVHRQYYIFDLATVFVLGAFLGVARWRSGSTTLAIVLHSLVNAVAFAETAFLAR